MITVKNVTKKYGKFTAVDNISFTIKEGEIVGLLRTKWCGKIHLCPVPLWVGKALQRNGAGSEQELFQKRTIETLLYGHAGCKPPALYRKCSG